jgi:transcriptional regulator with XRE-family HTH domain
MTKWETLLETRKLQNLSQDEIAVKLGINQSSVARAEVGIPAISAEYITQMCNILSVNPDFLKDKSGYPFEPGAFIKFYIKGLSARARPLAWMDLLMQYTEKINILILLREKNNNVFAVCAKDDKDTVFLISVDVPLTRKAVFDQMEKQYKKAGSYIVSEHFFFTPDLENWSREDIENLIDKAFADVLSNEEKKLIKLIREKKIPIETLLTHGN